MKYAIYFLAVGDNARRCLSLAYTSLRKAGFTNDVYILCDQASVPFATSSNTHILKIKDEHLNLDVDTDMPYAFFDVRRLDTRNPRSARNPRKWSICRAKTLIDQYITFDAYEYVVYLDVDVLAQGSASVMEDFLVQHKGAIITAQNQNGQRLGGRGNFSLRECRRVRTFSAANLTTGELFRYWFKKALCSDIVCIPTNTDGKQLMEAWRAEVQKDIDYDQPALQAVVLRHYSDMHILAPYSLFGYGPYHNHYRGPDTLTKVASTFVHFGGAIKDARAFKAYYTRYIAT